MTHVCTTLCPDPDGYPEWCRPTIRLMRRAERCAFQRQIDFDNFIWLLRRQIRHDRPAGSSMDVHLSAELITLADNNWAYQAPAFLEYVTLRQTLRWSHRAQDFFDVADEIREGGAV